MAGLAHCVQQLYYPIGRRVFWASKRSRIAQSSRRQSRSDYSTVLERSTGIVLLGLARGHCTYRNPFARIQWICASKIDPRLFWRLVGIAAHAQHCRTNCRQLSRSGLVAISTCFSHKRRSTPWWAQLFDAHVNHFAIRGVHSPSDWHGCDASATGLYAEQKPGL